MSIINSTVIRQRYLFTTGCFMMYNGTLHFANILLTHLIVLKTTMLERRTQLTRVTYYGVPLNPCFEIWKLVQYRRFKWYLKTFCKIIAAECLWINTRLSIVSLLVCLFLSFVVARLLIIYGAICKHPLLIGFSDDKTWTSEYFQSHPSHRPALFCSSPFPFSPSSHLHMNSKRISKVCLWMIILFFFFFYLFLYSFFIFCFPLSSL